MNKKLLRLSLFFVLFSVEAWASKFDAMVGFFYIEAEASGQTASINNIGSYKLQFNKSIMDSYDLFIGYTVNMSEMVGGDLGYGLDIGANYFPLTFSESSEYDRAGVSVRRTEMWRPYVGGSFNQRNFQSVRNGYAGFGVQAGTEYAYHKDYSLKGEFRYITLAGSSESTATEMNIFVGVSLKI